MGLFFIAHYVVLRTKERNVKIFITNYPFSDRLDIHQILSDLNLKLILVLREGLACKTI